MCAFNIEGFEIAIIGYKPTKIIPINPNKSPF